jgi:hypothetical protein
MGSRHRTHAQSLSSGDPERVALWPGRTPPVHIARGTPIRDATGIPDFALPVEAPANLELDPVRTGIPGEAIRARSAFSDAKDRLGS